MLVSNPTKLSKYVTFKRIMRFDSGDMCFPTSYNRRQKPANALNKYATRRKPIQT